MKIEKGKLYYDTLEEKLFKCGESQDEYLPATDKIAVQCPNEEDWDYVRKQYGIKRLDREWNIYKVDTCISVNKQEYCFYNFYTNKQGYHVISINQFKKFYTDPLQEARDFIDNLPDGCIAKLGAGGSDLLITSERGKKETSNKLNYELDFDFITQMAERMQTNKGKYEPYNWKKPIEIDGLKQAIFRHVLDIMKGNYEDDGRELGHLESLACNAMMLNYHLRK